MLPTQDSCYSAGLPGLQVETLARTVPSLIFSKYLAHFVHSLAAASIPLLGKMTFGFLQSVYRIGKEDGLARIWRGSESGAPFRCGPFVAHERLLFRALLDAIGT